LLDIATNFASGEEAVGAIFTDDTAKRKQKAEATEASGSRDPKKKKKDRKGKQGRSDDNLVAAADRMKPKRAPAGPGLFDEMLKKPCPYHRGPTKHTLEECTVLRRYYTDNIVKEGAEELPKDDDPQGEGFSKVKNCLLIFGGRAARLTASQWKHELREVCAVSAAAPSYLKWSERAITFDRQDHSDRIANPGSYLLIVDPIIAETRLTKVLMDGGSGLNILYAETLAIMGISKSRLRNDASPFHGVVPRHRAHPLGQIDLPVCFGTPDNFRQEVLTFDVVGFPGTYHTILGRPCYTKFMAVPNYTYLKLKMPGPNSIITVSTTSQHAYQCDVECVEQAEALAESLSILTCLGDGDQDVPDPKRHAGSFEPAKETKLVFLDPRTSEGKALRISSSLDPK